MLCFNAVLKYRRRYRRHEPAPITLLVVLQPFAQMPSRRFVPSLIDTIKLGLPKLNKVRYGCASGPCAPLASNSAIMHARHTLPFAILAPAPSRDSLIVFASARACVLRQVSKGAGTSGPPSSRARPQVIWCARPPPAECCPQLCTQTTPPLRLLTLV